jgi:hypothetical protein
MMDPVDTSFGSDQHGLVEPFPGKVPRSARDDDGVVIDGASLGAQ